MLPIVFHPDYLAAAPPGYPLADGQARLPARRARRPRPPARDRRLPRAGAALASPAPPPCTRSATSSASRTRPSRPPKSRAIGLPNTAAVARRAFLSSAGTLLAARLALEHGLGFNLAGGAHHAGPDGGAGFCVFNDVAIAAQALLDEGRVARVLVVDCDVHQGDGTARIFAGRPDVLTLSLHAERNYPARKAASHLDFPLPDRLGDRAYLEILAHALAAAEPFRPDLVFYNAGVDPHAEDRLGRLALTDAGLRARDALVIGWARVARPAPRGGPRRRLR